MARAKTWTDLLVKDYPVKGEGNFPFPAYSEFMPAPRLGMKPYGTWNTAHLSLGQPHRFLVSYREESQFLRPGIANIGDQVIGDLVAVATGRGSGRIGALHLENNPYWPKNLADGVRGLTHERFLMLSAVALSRTQDDKGRSRWTLFGGSNEGPSRAFWQSFRVGPDDEIPAAKGKAFLARLLTDVYGVPETKAKNLKAAGLSILPDLEDDDFDGWDDTPPPSYLQDLVLRNEDDIGKTRYLLTFRPFSKLAPATQAAYLDGRLHLLPYPGSLVFWGSQHYRKLESTLPGAIQIPLLQSIVRSEGASGIRVPQAGWFFVAGKKAKAHDARLGTEQAGFRRSHRWEWIERDESKEGLQPEQGIQRVLFSAHPDDVSLYSKPMARNAQVWSADFKALLHGPAAGANEVDEAMAAMKLGGSFGYRLYYPPMTIGHTPMFWHRPAIAWRDEAGAIKTMTDGFAGHVTAGEVQMWPLVETPKLAEPPLSPKKPAEATARARAKLNLRKLDMARQMLGGNKLPERFARALLTCDRDWTFSDWLADARKDNAADPALMAALDAAEKMTVPEKLKPSDAVTFGRTATRAFEEAYWTIIAELSDGRFTTTNNADAIKDPVTRKLRKTLTRDLDKVADYLVDYHTRLIAEAGMAGKAVCGAHRFRWHTDFEYDWMGGLVANTKQPSERNIVIVIPGKNRKEAVILADHYDTAFMEDVYGYGDYKGEGARVAAAGADDNHSATATLMLAAPIYLEMSKRGELACDIWLVHLTGEEFPSDCLGARHLARALVEGSLTLEVDGKKPLDLSGTKVRGLYDMDMIAHNNDNRRDVFQISPGTDPNSLWLAFEAQRAAELWRLNCAEWNKSPERKRLGRGQRSADPKKIPAMAEFLDPLGEVRLYFDPKSSMFNTDVQVVSDAGVPTVLFMENYDITRTGYHDQHDTMANIDLDFGAAVAAICIEAAVRAANGSPPDFEAIRRKMMGG